MHKRPEHVLEPACPFLYSDPGGLIEHQASAKSQHLKRALDRMLSPLSASAANVRTIPYSRLGFHTQAIL